MSFRPVRQWYYKPLAWTARCQKASLREQFMNYNCRLFDIRVKYDKCGNLTYAHGPIQFAGHVKTDLSMLNNLAELTDSKVYIRVVLECNKPLKDQALQEEHFKYFCEDLEEQYPHLTFFGGERKYDWVKVYNFNTPDVPLYDYYSSTTDPLGGKSKKWWSKLDDLWPWLFAKLHNKKLKSRYNDDRVLFLDFVNI